VAFDGKLYSLAENCEVLRWFYRENMAFLVSYDVDHGQVAPAVSTDFISEIRKTLQRPRKTNR